MEAGDDHKGLAEILFPGGSYGNGAAMRVAPVGLFFHEDLDRVWEQAKVSALPTHVHPLGIEGAQLLASAVAICLRRTALSRSDLLDELRRRCETSEFRDILQLAAEVETQADLLQLGNGIAAQDSVVTAIACFTLWPDSYEEVIGNAILLGGDTDTIAAMAGAIAGAHLGIGAIPAGLLESVEDGEKGRAYVTDLAAKLYAASVEVGGKPAPETE
jgi:poly(ADP-ribose) glycohydrolase ARH3